jgi:hypothetical protein
MSALEVFSGGGERASEVFVFSGGGEREVV